MREFSKSYRSLQIGSVLFNVLFIISIVLSFQQPKKGSAILRRGRPSQGDKMFLLVLALFSVVQYYVEYKESGLYTLIPEWMYAGTDEALRFSLARQPI